MLTNIKTVSPDHIPNFNFTEVTFKADQKLLGISKQLGKLISIMQAYIDHTRKNKKNNIVVT